MSKRPRYLSRATAIGATAGVATVAVTAGIATEIAHAVQPATAATVSGTTDSGTSSSGSSGTTRRSGHGRSAGIGQARIQQAPVGGSNGS